MQELTWQLWVMIGLALATLLFFIIWFFRRPLPPTPELPAPPIPVEPILLNFENLYPFQKGGYEQQSESWKQHMKTAGQIFEEVGVGQIILMHGTFVGLDPVSLFSPLSRMFPKLDAGWALRQQTKRLVDRLAKDNGNFLPSYVELLEQALGHNIACRLCYWSSANHHLARLEGALRLLEQFVQQPPPRDKRILLLGHSHARQVFAFFTQLLAETAMGEQLWMLIQEQQLATAELRTAARKLARCNFDFVTLGGPVRYPWAHLNDMRVLHIINHRGDSTDVSNPWLFWNTGSGDYVQQWGMIGSDVIALSAHERMLNIKLDLIVGKGWSVSLWLKSLVRRQRLGDFGRTLLVDYQDSSRWRPNFIKTVFGHGVYTRFEVMLFHTELICRYLYEKNKEGYEGSLS